MGMFNVMIKVGHPEGGDLRDIEVKVDTGAAHTVLPCEILDDLHIEPKPHRTFFFANGEQATWPIGEARIAFQGEVWTCPVIFAPHDKRLLGATTLEVFHVMVDPVKRVLAPIPLGESTL